VRRHETDFVSLVAGLLFLVVAAVHITARGTDTDLNLRWMVPAVLVLLGVLGLLGAIRSPRRGAATPASPAAVAEPGETADVDDTAVLDESDEASAER
jgi:hypothetical protein